MFFIFIRTFISIDQIKSYTNKSANKSKIILLANQNRATVYNLSAFYLYLYLKTTMWTLEEGIYCKINKNDKLKMTTMQDRRVSPGRAKLFQNRF